MEQSEILLKEYEEGNKICLQYEGYRRIGISFFFITQGAISTLLFSKNTDTFFELNISLSFIALFVSALTRSRKSSSQGLAMARLVGFIFKTKRKLGYI